MGGTRNVKYCNDNPGCSSDALDNTGRRWSEAGFSSPNRIHRCPDCDGRGAIEIESNGDTKQYKPCMNEACRARRGFK